MDIDAAKEEFLKEFGEHYGYPNGPKSIDQIRATEFTRLQGLVYLDHAGATLYSELQMQSVFSDLTNSQSESSSATLDILNDARQQVLDYCNASAKDYKCIFTSGATAALKLLTPGECRAIMRCNMGIEEIMMINNSSPCSSLTSIRYALGQGAKAIAVDIEEDVHPVTSGETISMNISPHGVQRRKVAGLTEGEPTGDTYNLFAFPSECNFSGLRFGLDLVNIIKENSRRISGISSVCNFDLASFFLGAVVTSFTSAIDFLSSTCDTLDPTGQWMVLIDAAKGCATMPPDLSKYPADFITISFYKLFGYPTGLGALIVRNGKLLQQQQEICRRSNLGYYVLGGM
ncbi:hypothetical protein Lal_00019142 [Lupinus albus]|nr:hypothetical protein Lal_00019142 [Lupinus albus]